MITITIPITKLFDSKKNEFLYPVKQPIQLSLEHSLVSLYKWESKYHRPFLEKKEKTMEETLDYIRCMCLTPNIDPDVFRYIPPSELAKVAAYINDPMTATWFREGNASGSKKNRVVTAEIIYYWMISLGIPVEEFESRHLNQLITLIRVVNIENTPTKKKNNATLLSEYAALNKKNRERWHTKG